jgi:hypothetical protein
VQTYKTFWWLKMLLPSYEIIYQGNHATLHMVPNQKEEQLAVSYETCALTFERLC